MRQHASRWARPQSNTAKITQPEEEQRPEQLLTRQVRHGVEPGGQPGQPDPGRARADGGDAVRRKPLQHADRLAVVANSGS